MTAPSTCARIDNDMLDLDPTPGIIRDAANIAVPAQAFGRGGCTLNPNARFDPLFPLIYLLFALGVFYRRWRWALSLRVG